MKALFSPRGDVSICISADASLAAPAGAAASSPFESEEHEDMECADRVISSSSSSGNGGAVSSGDTPPAPSAVVVGSICCDDWRACELA